MLPAADTDYPWVSRSLMHNTASRRVLARNGFTPIGVAPRYIQIAGRWQDHLLHQLLADEGDAAVSGGAAP